MTRFSTGASGFECVDAAFSRRRFLGACAAGAAYAMLPKTALASLSGSADPRLLVIVLRGALDGLAAVPPVGDADYARLRAGFDLQGQGVIDLDGFFALNANMPNLAKLYAARQALIVHGASTPYRGRSHFAGQDMLESGLRNGGGDTGWLNRATETLASSARAKPARGLAIGYSAPLIMRGAAPVMSWAPQGRVTADADSVARIAGLYEAREPALAAALREAFAMPAAPTMDGKGGNTTFIAEIEQTARFFMDPEGPRIAALSSDGWDTHARQDPRDGRLAALLRSLDEGIALLADRLAPIWNDTAVVIATEFGRTAAINGTEGTDHGTGTAAFLIGGAVKGGRVVSDWPGLTDAALHEGRDLKPTIDITSVFKGLLQDQFGIDAKALASRVFPGSAAVPPMGGLIV